jgi:hypothetical protein
LPWRKRGDGEGEVDWSPRQDYQLVAADRIYVLATRAGLSGILRRAQKGEENPAPAPAGAPDDTSQ